MLICIIGPDGVGKSTQANLIIENMRKRGFKCEYRWLRFNHFFVLPILVFARLIGLSEVVTLDDGSKIGYHYYYKSNFISTLFIILTFIDSLFSTIWKVYIPVIIQKKNLVCDRFIYDTLVDLMVSTGKYDILLTLIGKLFIKIIPKNTRTILLCVDENVLRKRRIDVEFDKNIYIKIRLYYYLAHELNLTVINADRPIEQINKLIINEICGGYYGH